MDVKISIIMGVFNPVHGEWLQAAVQSLIDQTMTEWELILCDDGSDEKYVERIQSCQKMDARIRLIRNKKNQGLAYSLNQCLKYVRGKYVARMDDDDISKPDRLKRQYEWLESHPEYAWAGTWTEMFDEHGVWELKKYPEYPKARDYLFNSPYIHPSVMFRRDVLQQAGGYLVAKMTRRREDYELFMRLEFLGYKGYNIPELLFCYRETADSYRKRKFRYRIDEMQVRYTGFRKMGILNITTFPYVVKPLIVGMIPPSIHRVIKRRIRHVT